MPYNLLIMVERGERFERCQAVIHHTKCDGYADDVDHFTPISIQNSLRIAPEDRSEDNLLPMNRSCHIQKDVSTSIRSRFLRDQIKNNKQTTLADYKKLRNKYDAVAVPAFDGD